MMRIIDEREMEKTTKEKQKKTERSKGNRSYSERVRAKWFCCAFKLCFLQSICKASLIFKFNLDLALSITLKQLCKQLGVYPKFLIFKLPNVSNKDALSIRKRLLRSTINLQHLKRTPASFKRTQSIQKLFIYTAFYYWLLHPYKIHNIV